VGDGDTIAKVAKSDNAVTTVFQEADTDSNTIDALAVDDANVYWTSSDGVIHSIAK
jgi:hypothetical protein